MNDITTALTTVLVAIIGVATVAVVLSKNANTAAVEQNLFVGFSQALGTAVSPITSSGSFGNQTYSYAGVLG
jgi:hypothetical protein